MSQLQQQLSSFNTVFSSLENSAAQQRAQAAQELSATYLQIATIQAQLARENQMSQAQRTQIRAELAAKIEQIRQSTIAARQKTADRHNLMQLLNGELSKPNSVLLPQASSGQTEVDNYKSAVNNMVMVTNIVEAEVQNKTSVADTTVVQAEPHVQYIESYTGGGGSTGGGNETYNQN